MAIGTVLKFAKIGDLYLDHFNPRLGRDPSGKKAKQNEILDQMRDWTLDELAISYLESGGFWTHEALLVIKENLDGKSRLVVIEGNRRLAALKHLFNATKNKPATQKWKEMAKGAKIPDNLFSRIPYILVEKRKDVEAFLGFRHVTGIKEWRPTEKARYIAHLIDDSKMDYAQVMRLIGSKTPTVRQTYISYRMLLQYEDYADLVPQENIDRRFSVMNLSLRTEGVQNYLHIDILAEPSKAKKPVPRKHLKNLANFALWIFGDADKDPLFTDSRRVDTFGALLENSKALNYLETADDPSFDMAFALSGGDEADVIDYVEEAADNIELALRRAHLHSKSKKLRNTVSRLAAGAKQLLKLFPSIYSNFFKEED